MSNVRVDAVAAEQMPTWQAVLSRAFGEDVHPEGQALEFAMTEVDRTLAAWVDGAMVGTASLYSYDMAVPGAVVPVAGVSAVGVLPTARRRGVLTALMRRQLDDIHVHGREAVALLWASEPGIYGRFGYGQATSQLALTVPRAHSGFTRPVEYDGALHLLPATEARPELESVYDAVWAQRPGAFRRTAARWDYLLEDTEFRRAGRGSRQVVVARSAAGHAEGYTTYWTKKKWEPGGPSGTVDVESVVAQSPQAYAALWQHLLGIDLMTQVTTWARPVDDPLLHLLANPRRSVPTITDQCWARVIDLPRAVAQRAWSAEATLVVQVTDDHLPHNAGRWVLDLSTDGGTCTQTDREPDLVLPVQALGAIYFGGTSLLSLQGAGMVDERTLGATDLLDRAARWPVAPCCPEVF